MEFNYGTAILILGHSIILFTILDQLSMHIYDSYFNQEQTNLHSWSLKSRKGKKTPNCFIVTQFKNIMTPNICWNLTNDEEKLSEE